MSKKINLLVGVLLVFGLISCHKDEDSFTEIDGSLFTAEVVQEIQSSISGYVYDENNLPVANAIVEIYSTVVTTNAQGIFTFNKVKMDKQGTYIKVRKDGYFLGSDYVYPSERATTFAYVQLLALDQSSTFKAANGGKVNIVGGGTIDFAPNSIVKSDGSVYTGDVRVSAKYLDPRDSKISDQMPGGLIADAANGNTVVLGTLGMVAVELRDDFGNELNLGNGQKATITFPINTSFQPNEIELWSFDENKGRWLEEGKAIKIGQNYVAEVSHFSFWNCDAPFSLINVCGKVLYEGGEPAANILIKVEAEGLGVGYGYTNSEGEYCGKMPKNKVLTITATRYGCEPNSISTQVGPFANNVELDPIVIESPITYILSGQITCGATPVDDGFIVLTIGNEKRLFSADESGNFSYDISYLICANIQEVSVYGIEYSSGKLSSVITSTIDEVEGLTLDVCNSPCALDNTFTQNCSNTIETNVTGGSGNYTYLWTLGETTSSVSINLDSFNINTYCVTVTDVVNNCESVFCKLVDSIGFNVFIEYNCFQGDLFGNAYGGIMPYSYLWSNGATTNDLSNLNPGEYCLTVTDLNGCTASRCITVYNSGFYFDPNTSCNGHIANITTDIYDYGYLIGSGQNWTPIPYPAEVNVLTSGFNFTLNVTVGFCSFQQTYSLPQLIEGLTANGVNTTCPTCNDGYITITSNPNAPCQQCTFGQVKVYKSDNLTVDLSTQNDQHTLSKGTYYVVVTDQNTNCVIASRRAVIN